MFVLTFNEARRSLVDLPDPGLSLGEPSSTGMSCGPVDLGSPPATTKGSVTWSSILSSSVERSVLSSVTPVSMTPSDSFLSGSLSGGQVKHCYIVCLLRGAGFIMRLQSLLGIMTYYERFMHNYTNFGNKYLSFIYSHAKTIRIALIK